ncbi:sulfite oxidase [Alteribacillus sp. YIM 98480]|uniref:sulfite oxidase n=1 Tax=Alteribacillus sp. YIM 98480 TaxID=2606599 RepID=UPI00131A77A7|nr:sulfite oxidase [Alteribacillus sp. YIM 98480]
MLIYYYKNKPYLITRSLNPENQECPVHFLQSDIISSEYVFRRNHFSFPFLTPENFTLSINGCVNNPLTFHYVDLLNMPAKKIDMVIECAGNKRAKFEPRVYGEQWEDGAITYGRWKGVPLFDLLSFTEIQAEGQEIVFEGFDAGKHKDTNEIVSFARSLPLQNALHPDVLVAYQYNDQPLTFKHGFPLRLIVPQWYGMASVKWLKRITVIDRPFHGPFQTLDYVYYFKSEERRNIPVTYMNVNSIIQQPLDQTIRNKGNHLIKGIAWTGRGNISEVVISFDQGKTWHPTLLNKSIGGPYSWVTWQYLWQVDKKGEYTIWIRASDSAGRVQPKKPVWNKKGYGYNAISEVHVKIE